MSDILQAAWAGAYEEVRQRSIEILKTAGEEVYVEMHPFVANLARWSADFAIAKAQGDEDADKNLEMCISQMGMIAAHVGHEAAQALRKVILEDILIIARVLGTVIKTVAL
jgi:hypothetical protein